MATSGLLVGTFAGVYRFVDQVPKVAALRDNVITHLSVGASGRVAAAAVPVLGPVHNMYKAQQFASGEQLSGVHLLHLPGEEAASAGVPESQWVWRGDARSCLVWEPPPPPPSDGQGAAPVGLAAGTEPADVFCSLDGGRSWSAGSHGFAAAPSRGDWSFPAPPHKPHVLSLEALPPAQSPAASPPSPTRGVHDPAAALAQQPELAAGIEVGGVLVGGRRGGGPDGADAWQERNGGLYPDIHSCRIDPHDPRHWLAVTGRGLYATRDAGASWQRQCPEVWAGRYTVGLAFNPERQGEVLVAAGDRPPALGVHVYRSADGGESWADITERVFANPGCAEARGERTPVPYFWRGQALLGTDTGHLLGAQDAERRRWAPLARLPSPVTCLAAPGQSPSSVMH